jgi:hypothetical protein
MKDYANNCHSVTLVAVHSKILNKDHRQSSNFVFKNASYLINLMGFRKNKCTEDATTTNFLKLGPS